MSNFVVDVEADGPCPGMYSMVCFGAVKVESLKTGNPETFYGECKPMTDAWIPEALAVSGFTREKCLTFPSPLDTMREFNNWVERVNRNGRPIFWSDNLAFDWQFNNYYFHYWRQHNPFGWSGRRIGDYYCGQQGNLYAKWKHLRKTKHDHNPVNDALGNAEAMIEIGIV